MSPILELVGPNRAVQLFGIRFVGINAENGKKLLFTLSFILLVWAFSRLLNFLAQRIVYRRGDERIVFWVRQGVHLGSTVILILGIASIWFDDPSRLTTALGLITAGLAFALQKVVTALAGYFVILRGKTFNVGDRITMGGVRGDVIALGFTQTTLMEMGQPPAVQSAEPAMWVKSRQYTGRIVTISNAKIFDEPVYNYSREFPYIWEEISLPISYSSDRDKAESILLDAAAKHTVNVQTLSQETLEEMQRRYFMKPPEMTPQVFYRITDNWLELTVRIIVHDHGVREVKDRMSRDILQALDVARIGIASATYEIVGIPPLRFRDEPVDTSHSEHSKSQRSA